jgi:hypothetical protein
MKINTTQFAAAMAYSGVRVVAPSVPLLVPSARFAPGVESARTSTATKGSASGIAGDPVVALGAQSRTTLVNCITDPGRETWRPPV